MISWKAGGGWRSEGLGQVERGFDIASSDVSASQRSLLSHILNLLCLFVISFDQRPTNSKQYIYILQNRTKEWFPVQGRHSLRALLKYLDSPCMIEGEESMLQSAIQKQSTSKAKKKKRWNFHPLKKKVKRNLSKFKFGEHFWRSEMKCYRELRMEQTMVHWPEISVKEWNSLNSAFLYVLKD